MTELVAETTEPAARSVPSAFVPGIFDDLPAATYHAIEAMSSGGAKKMLQSPAHYVLMRTKANEPTPAMQFGTACHSGILEPHTFDQVVVRAPKFNRRTNAGKEEAEAFDQANVGKVVLSPDDFDRCRRVIDAVRAHPAANQLLAGAEIEKSFFWNDGRYKVPCKARWDARNHGLAIDLKTTQDASPEGFARSIATFAYDVQSAHYLSAGEHCLDETPAGFVFIAVESEAPFAVGCYVLGSASILAGERRLNVALERYARARETGTWPGYASTIEVIETPAWRRKVA